MTSVPLLECDPIVQRAGAPNRREEVGAPCHDVGQPLAPILLQPGLRCMAVAS